jgi:hypothetical protein
LGANPERRSQDGYADVEEASAAEAGVGIQRYCEHLGNWILTSASMAARSFDQQARDSYISPTLAVRNSTDNHCLMVPREPVATDAPTP